MTIATYTQLGGKHPETAALANVLASYGTTAPHSGKPYSEAMLLGVGGGLGGGYWVFEMCGRTWLILGFRHLWQSTRSEFLHAACMRIGAGLDVRETGSRKTAEAQLREVLASETPAILSVSLAGLPHQFLPDDYLKAFIHTAVVCGYDEVRDEFLIDDRGATPFRIGADRLAVARGAITLQKNRMLLVRPPVSPADLPSAIEAGIRDCCTGLLEPPIRNFGLPAIAKWADLVTNSKDKKGWPKVMPPGRKLFQALSGTFHGIETAGTGGGALRKLYADFLDEAAGATGRSELREIGGTYRELAGMWSALADAALPDAAEPLGRAKRLLVGKNKVLEERGADGLDEAAGISEEFRAIEASVEGDFPLGQTQIDALLKELRARLLAIHGAETAAAERLKTVVH